mgnify:CR=1 FL=1
MIQTTVRFSTFALLSAAALVLAGCGVGTDGGATRAVAVPHPMAAPVVAVPETPQAAAARAYYGQVQQALLWQRVLSRLSSQRAFSLPF